MARVAWYWLLSPAAILLLLFFAVPIVLFGLASAHPDLGSGVQGSALTIGNYLAVLTRPMYLRSFWTTAVLSGSVTLLATAIAFPAAYIIARQDNALTRTFLIIMLAPNFVTPVVRSIGWVLSLGMEGPINRLLVALGWVDQPLRMVSSLSGVVIGEIHYVLPLLIFILVGVIRRIDPILEEAAASLGAPRWRVFMRVVLPLCVRPLVTTSLMIFSLTVSIYTTVVLLGGGQVLTIPVLIAQEVLSRARYGIGSALAVLLWVMVWLIATASSRWSAAERGQPA